MVKDGGKELPKKIVCSVDYSDASERALNNAIKIARTFKSDLQIINVLKPMDARYSPRYKVDFALENKRLELENIKRFLILALRKRSTSYLWVLPGRHLCSASFLAALQKK